MANHSLEVTIGNNIAKYRNLANMTQEQLAEKIGVSPAFISRVERGQKMMKVRNLYSTSQVLHVSCDALLYQDDAVSQLGNIMWLLTNQPVEYLPGIEKLIRVCIEEFNPKSELLSDKQYK